MEYEGQWEAKGINDEIESVVITLVTVDGKLEGAISFTPQLPLDMAKLAVSERKDSIDFMTEASTQSGYAVSFHGTPVDDNTIQGPLGIGAASDHRVQLDVTFVRVSK